MADTIDAFRALHNFWSSFGLKAYDENSVPDNAMETNGGKYLTYSVSDGFFDDVISLSASLWYKSTAWADITKKAEEIAQNIGYGGKLVPFDGGAIWLKRASPFAQRMADEDDTIRRIYIMLWAEYLKE